MIGKKIIYVILFFVTIANAIDEKNILIVPANINYEKAELEFISSSIYETFSDSIAVVNNKNLKEEKDNIRIKELVTADKKYSKKIKKFFKSIENDNFIAKLKNKYNIDTVIWYDFKSSILKSNGNIKNKFDVNFCYKKTDGKKKICETMKMKFDNKLYFINKKSYKKLKSLTRKIMNESTR